MFKLVKFKNDQIVYYVNPDSIAYLRSNIGNMTYIAIRAGVDNEHGEMPFVLVEGDIDAVAKKLTGKAD